jgi:hypothetical protein
MGGERWTEGSTASTSVLCCGQTCAGCCERRNLSRLQQKIGLRSERTSFGTAGAGAAGEAVTTAASTPVAALASESIASRERARKSKEDHDHENAHIPRQRCSRLAREGPGNDKYTHVCVCSTYTHASEHELVEEGACLCSDCCNLISSASRARF